MTAYNLSPEIKIKEFESAWQGYDAIANRLMIAVKEKKKSQSRVIVAIESYPGVRNKEIKEKLLPLLNPAQTFFADDLALTGKEITEIVRTNLTDDRVFGVMSHFELKDFFLEEKLKGVRSQFKDEGLIIIYGTGATVISHDPDVLIYADLARWEIQCRYRSHETGNWKLDNYDEDVLRKYKRGYFFEWRMADRQKKEYTQRIDFYLDTNIKDNPKLITGTDYRRGLKQIITQPFRLVPYFDESVWGGYWMKKHFHLDSGARNFGWAFDGVPEENSLYMAFGNIRVEIPAINVVQNFPNELLGEKVHSRFGTEFPIRFDYLDTMGGGNLSLQVHPLVEYIQDKFGMHYTQDESYYILDAKDDSAVYLGVKQNTIKDELMNSLEKAQSGNGRFPIEKYINKFPVKKHDHILIPAGTIHCSGRNTVVLEISATPYIFTFKLWDWDRKGLDGLPRPINIEHGRKNIQMNRNTTWVKRNLMNRFKLVYEDQYQRTEKTGLHELEFIETWRHWFTQKAVLETHNSVNMLNLVEGDQVVVESPKNNFEPFKVNYGETFIVPEQIKHYTIRPTNPTNKEYAIIQAFVRY